MSHISNAMIEQVLVNVCSILSWAFQNTVDEEGNPLNIPVRAAYPNTGATPYPSVLISLRLGQIVFGPGQNLIMFDSEAQQNLYGVRAPNSQVVCTIRSRSDAERVYLTDRLTNQLLTGYAIDSAFSPDVFPNYISTLLSDTGLVMTAIDPIVFSSARLNDQRQEGQVYEAVVPLVCQAYFAWYGPPTTPVTQINIGVSPAADVVNGLPSPTAPAEAPDPYLQIINTSWFSYPSNA